MTDPTTPDSAPGLWARAADFSAVGGVGYCIYLLGRWRAGARLSFLESVADGAICIFGAVMTGYAADALGLSREACWAAAGTAGHLGPRSVFLLRDRLLAAVLPGPVVPTADADPAEAAPRQAEPPEPAIEWPWPHEVTHTPPMPPVRPPRPEVNP